ncbi:hypothetical protein XarbCFBP8150_21300, partial [Xanthomonas arboricola]|uniref:hypothetical protein n=1 Tax=Xanthomonas arboricola TaxID=56448 RepID=UPI000D42009F
GLRRWLSLSRPQLRLADLQIAGEQGGAVRAQAADARRIAYRQKAQFLDPGLRGRIDGDTQAIQLDPAADATLRFDWPTGFGVVHELQLAGSIV